MHFQILSTVTIKLIKYNNFNQILWLKLFCVFRMPNNASRKAARREKLAANKAARNAACLSMFNPNVARRTVNISRVVNANPLNNTVKLRAPDSFTGPFGGQLLHNEMKQMQLLGLPVKNQQKLTQAEQATVNAIARENAADRITTKSASMYNGIGVTGDQYLYDTVYPKTQTNLNQLASHRAEELSQTLPNATRRLRAKAKYLRYTMGQGAQRLLPEANAIKASEGYSVAQPTARSLANAQAAHRFAQNHYAGRFNTVRQPIQVEPPRQSSPGFFGGLFRSCFGESCPVNDSAIRSTFSTENPLYRRGGRSRQKRKHSRKH